MTNSKRGTPRRRPAAGGPTGRRHGAWPGLVLSVGIAFAGGRSAWAEPLVPTSDAQIVEVLPDTARNRDEARRMRRMLTERPADARLAVSLARRELAQAREAGDPRFAGLALSALQRWPDPARAPDEVLLVRATLQQFLHDFDASIDTLRTLVARPSGERLPDAWLTLATVLRVQGRYADSDAACRRIEAAGAALYAAACLAENAGLRGEVDAARRSFQALLDAPENAAVPAVRAWLLTSVAELEERAARPAAAEAAFRESIRLAPDAYTTLDYADFLIDQRRPKEALQALRAEPRTDAVLLRLAIAGAAAGTPEAARDAAEMRERITLANQRPGAERFHGREQAMFALRIDRDPARAWALARGNVVLQREAIDLQVLAEAALATGDPAALVEARRTRAEVGLHDRRVDALLR